MKRFLVLENGKVFEGEAFGADGEVTAEIVFTTAVTGYMETLTDRSFTGQAVVQTFPLIGNYGYITEDAESDRPGVAAYIVKSWCDHPSNYRSEGDLDTYLKMYGIVGLCGIDTRSLTRILREHGTMNGMITDDPKNADIEKIRSYRITKPVNNVCTKEIRHFENNGKRVALYDFGVKENIVRSLVARGCEVYVLPANTTAEEVLALKPDGLFLTNGPGNPVDNVEIIENIKKLLPYKIPTMGICLGHQLLALANGFKTEKLKYGHRGGNHPARDLTSERVYITSQNHGYAVVGSSIDKNIAEELFINVNDKTNEGVIYKNAPAFSVQFHPEACPGPLDSEFLFDEFLKLMDGEGRYNLYNGGSDKR